MPIKEILKNVWIMIRNVELGQDIFSVRIQRIDGITILLKPAGISSIVNENLSMNEKPSKI